MSPFISTDALRRRLRKAVDGGASGRQRRSWGEEKAQRTKVSLLVCSLGVNGSQAPRCGSEHIRSGYRKACNSTWECLASWAYLHNETVNIYSHVLGAFIFILFPLFVFNHGVPSRWDVASISDVVVCAIYAAGVTICFILSTAFHTFMSHSESYYLSGIKADFYGVLALMWSSTAPLAHYTFPCSPRTRDAYVLATGVLAVLCGAATARPNLGAVHLGRHRAVLFAAFGAAAFVAPSGHGALASGIAEEWARVGGRWVGVTAGCNGLAVLVYWAKFPEMWFPRTFDLFGASHQIMHVMVLAAALAYAKAVVAAFDYSHARGVSCGS
ncbi:hemolysin-iii channel protein [Colletotrichum musicola]|uniref:Hemolysin-iii channel protein n=1 Tax=Colletotrichum musicola TaxID=2175873 RepID=A0A8H6NZ16_9PEZI|nr:hemolysin-iii channel protein [Colletotrichum musicola]